MNAKALALRLGVALGAAVVHVAASAASEKAPALSGIVAALETAVEGVFADLAAKEAATLAVAK